jgi:hypothetical protein
MNWMGYKLLHVVSSLFNTCSVVDPNSFFSDSDPQIIFFGFGYGFGFLRLIFWPQIFLNGASSCFPMCSETCTSEKKKFPIEKHKIFVFQVFDFWFFTKIFILQQCLNPNPYPYPNFFSDSDPAKTFGLFRIRIHNTGITGPCDK